MYFKELFAIQYATDDVEHTIEMWVTKDVAIQLIVGLEQAGATDISLLRWDGQWWCRENLP